MNWKKREVLARKMSRIFRQPQAAGKTGLVIRMAIANLCEKIVMAAPFSRRGAGNKEDNTPV
jgi:hypothetical protein